MNRSLAGVGEIRKAQVRPTRGNTAAPELPVVSVGIHRMHVATMTTRGRPIATRVHRVLVDTVCREIDVRSLERLTTPRRDARLLVEIDTQRVARILASLGEVVHAGADGLGRGATGTDGHRSHA